MGLPFVIVDVPEQIASRIKARAEMNRHSLQEELLAILTEAARETSPSRAERGIDDALRRWRTAFPQASPGPRTLAQLVAARPIGAALVVRADE